MPSMSTPDRWRELWFQYCAEPKVLGRDFDDFLIDQIERLEASIRQHRNELPMGGIVEIMSNRTDKERLDWIDVHEPSIETYPDLGFRIYYFWRRDLKDCRTERGSTIRDAIDKAMDAERD